MPCLVSETPTLAISVNLDEQKKPAFVRLDNPLPDGQYLDLSTSSRLAYVKINPHSGGFDIKDVGHTGQKPYDKCLNVSYIITSDAARLYLFSFEHPLDVWIPDSDNPTSDPDPLDPSRKLECSNKDYAYTNSPSLTNKKRILAAKQIDSLKIYTDNGKQIILSFAFHSHTGIKYKYHGVPYCNNNSTTSYRVQLIDSRGAAACPYSTVPNGDHVGDKLAGGDTKIKGACQNSNIPDE